MHRTSRFVAVASSLATLFVSASVSLPTFADATGGVSGTVTITKDGSTKKDRSNVAVFIEGVPGDIREGKTQVIHQKELTFLPGIVVVPRGTSVDFPNDDKVFHNVFSVSKGAKFDLGLYKSGTTKSVTFKNAGVVDVYCNIHPQMQAKIRVIESNHYAITGADGSFKITGIPAGKYTIVGWQAFGEEFRGEVTVTAGGNAKVDIALTEQNAPQHHLRKDGTPYGRYK